MIDKLTFNAHQISAWTVEALIIIQSTKLIFLDVGAKDKPAIDQSEGSAYSQWSAKVTVYFFFFGILLFNWSKNKLKMR